MDFSTGSVSFKHVCDPCSVFSFRPWIYLFLFNGPNNIVFNFGPSYFVLVSNLGMIGSKTKKKGLRQIYITWKGIKMKNIIENKTK
jgi:hypothetical protein